MANRLHLFLESQDALKRYAEELLNDSDEENDGVFIALEEHLEYSINAHARLQQMEKHTAEANDKIKKAKSDSEIDTFFSSYLTDMENAKNLDVASENATYQEFLKLLDRWKAKSMPEDDEICTIKEQLNTVDPITKKALVDPVKNKKCGHVYEKTAILQLIAQNPMTKCPIMGCNNVSLTPSDIAPDLKLKRLLLVQKAEAAANVSCTDIF